MAGGRGRLWDATCMNTEESQGSGASVRCPPGRRALRRVPRVPSTLLRRSLGGPWAPRRGTYFLQDPSVRRSRLRPGRRRRRAGGGATWGSGSALCARGRNHRRRIQAPAREAVPGSREARPRGVGLRSSGVVPGAGTPQSACVAAAICRARAKGRSRPDDGVRIGIMQPGTRRAGGPVNPNRDIRVAALQKDGVGALSAGRARGAPVCGAGACVRCRAREVALWARFEAMQATDAGSRHPCRGRSRGEDRRAIRAGVCRR